MPDSIHGHEVMHMMMESGASYTVASLRAAIEARFGPTARFHTCSAENMTAEELVAFLAARGKFVPVGEGFTTGPDRMCSHGDGHDHQH